TTAFLSSGPLGAFPEGKGETLFDALQRICNITHEACFGMIYGDMSPITFGGGDVISVRKTLECAVAFKAAGCPTHSRFSNEWETMDQLEAASLRLVVTTIHSHSFQRQE